MDFSAPFGYPFKDQNWFSKLLIAGLITLIPIVGMLYLLGWGLEITKQIIHNEPIVIPETDFGKFLTRGLKAFVISLVYSIPALIFQIPNTIANVMAQSASNGDSSSAVLGGVMALSVCSGLLNMVYSLALAFILPAVYCSFLVNGEQISAGFQFSAIFGLVKKAPVAFLLALVGNLIASMISGLGFIACIIGLLVTIPYGILITSHFYGQAYLEATKA
jgi:hypothetical protein